LESALSKRAARWPPFCFELAAAYAPFSHFFMKLALAAPASGLPSEPTALVAQSSAMHFFMNEVFAAPASGLPSLPTALVSQVSCAKAEPAANVATMAARTIFFMRCLPKPAVSRLETQIGMRSSGIVGFIDKIASCVACQERLEVGARPLR